MPRAQQPPCAHDQRASGRRRIRIDGKDVYLGPIGSARARRVEERLQAEWVLRNGAPTVRTVAGIVEAYCRENGIVRGARITNTEDVIRKATEHALADTDLATKRAAELIPGDLENFVARMSPFCCCTDSGIHPPDRPRRLAVGTSQSTLTTGHTSCLTVNGLTLTAVFVSKDENHTKAHARYLESRLTELATQAGRAVVADATSQPCPPLPEADIADTEYFRADRDDAASARLHVPPARARAGAGQRHPCGSPALEGRVVGKLSQSDAGEGPPARRDHHRWACS